MKAQLQRLDARLQRASHPALAAIGLLYVAVIALSDLACPGQVSFTLFYLVGVVFVAWYSASQRTTLVISLAGACALGLQELIRDLPAYPWVPVWNVTTRLITYVGIGWLSVKLSQLRHNLERLVNERTGLLKAEVQRHSATSARLTESLERFEQVINNIGEVFWLTDVSKRQVAYVSPAYERIWGRKCEDLYRERTSWMDSLHPQDRDIVARRSLSDQITGNYDVEYRIVRPDGEVRWIRDRAFPVRNAQGEVCRIAGLAEDITERKRTEKALRQSEEGFRVFVNALPEPALLLDRAGVVLVANEAVANSLGLRPNDLSGRCIFDLLPPEVATRRKAMLNECAATRTPIQFEDRRGDRTFISWVSPVLDSKDMVSRVAVFAFDISRRQRAEEALRQSEESLRVFLDALQEPAMLLDRDGTIIVANEALAHRLELAKTDLAGKPAFDLLPREVAEPRRRRFEEVVRTAQAAQFEDERNNRHFINCLSPVLDSTGAVARVAGMALDITARKSAELTRDAFLSLGTKLSTAADPKEAAMAIYATADLLWKWDCGALDLFLPESGLAENLVAWDVVDGKRRTVTPLESSHHPSGRARRIMREGAELILRQPGETPAADFFAMGDTSRLSASLMCVPIRREGQPVGVLSIQSYTPNAYTPDDLRTLQALADYGGGALERLTMEASARQRDALNRAILASAMDGYYILDFAADPRGAFVEANDAYCRMTGYTREELLQKCIADLEAIESPVEIARRVENIRARQGGRFETRHRRKDGQEVHVEISVSVLAAQAGNLFSFVRDITERKLAEAALVQKEALYRTLFDLSPDGILLEDMEGQILDANQALCQTFGYSHEELLGKNVRCFVPPDAHAQVEAHLAALQAGQTLEHEVLNVRKDGQRCLMRLKEKPLLLPDEHQGILLVARDVTTSRRAEVTREAFLFLGTRLSTAGNPLEAARALYASADLLWKWDSASFDLYIPESGRIQPVLNCDIVGGQRREVPPAFPGALPSVRMRRILDQGAELILEDRPTSSAEFATFGNTSRLSASMMYVPLRREGRSVGVLSIHSYTPNAYSQEDLRTLQALADHCGGALERIRAEQALRENEEQLRAFYDSPGGLRGIVELLQDDAQFVSANKAEAAIYGRTVEEMRSVRVTELGLPKPFLELWLSKFRESLERNGPVSFEYSSDFRSPGGWGLATVCPLFLSGSQRPRIAFLAVDITERKHAEAALRQSHEKLEQRVQDRTAELQAANNALHASESWLRLALDASSAGVWSWDAQTNTSAWDDRYHEMYGFGPDDPRSNEAWLSRLHPEDRKHLTARIDDLLQPGAGDVWNQEFRVLHPTKGERWMSGLGRIDRDSAGRAIRFAGINLDITKRKGAEEAQRAQLAYIQTIYQNAPVGLCVLDANLRYTQINERLAAMNGLSVQQHIGRTMRETVPHLAEWSEAICRQIFATGQPVLNLEVTGQTDAQPGMLRTWVSSWVPLKEADGTVVGISVVVEEVTERKRLDQALRDSESKYRRLHESMTDAFVRVDMEGRITEFNRAYQTMLGYTRGRTASDCPTLTSLPSNGTRSKRESWPSRSCPRGYSDVYEKEYRRKDGTVFPVELRTFLLRDDQGKPTGMWAIVRDISERKRAEAALREAHDTLEAARPGADGATPGS